MFEKVRVKPRLSAILKERGIDSIELELLTGVSLAVIHRFDRSISFDIRDLIKLSRALDMTVEEMFDIHTEEEVCA